MDDVRIRSVTYPGTLDQFDAFMGSLMRMNWVDAHPDNPFRSGCGQWESTKSERLRFTNGIPKSLFEMATDGITHHIIKGVWRVWATSPDGTDNEERMASIRAFEVADHRTEVHFRDEESWYGGSPAEPIGEAFEEFRGYVVGLFPNQPIRQSESPQETPRVPRRPADRRRWKAIWRKVKGEAEKGKSVKAIADWLKTSAVANPNLPCSADTLSDIIRAGEAGLLDDRIT